MCRPFYASLGIMTSRMVLHLLKNLARVGDLDIAIIDLNWTLDTETRNRTCSRLYIMMIETDAHTRNFKVGTGMIVLYHASCLTNGIQVHRTFDESCIR